MVSMIWEMYWRREPSHFVKIIRHDISIVEKHMGDMAAKHLYDDNTDEDEAKED